MNKARKKTHKPGIAKRLVRGSLVLSCTRFVSSRIVRFFETGLASPLLRSVKTVDHFVRKKVTGPIFKKVGLRKKFAMPMKNSVASFFIKNPVVQTISKQQSKVLNTPLRTLGLFMLTFGIYATAIFLLKRFVSLSIGEADADDLIVSALAVVGGIMLTLFGEKSVISAFGKSRITGTLLSNVLGVNDSALYKTSPQRQKTSIGMSFLLGSLLGVLTMFVSPLKILMYIGVFVGAVMILNMPEFGLLTAITALFFLPSRYLSIICLVTLISYLLKCLRLKRNFRFGTADVLVLILFISTVISCASGGFNSGEMCLIGFTSMYFVAKNTFCSEKLISQAANALSLGAMIGMALYIVGEFAPMIDHTQLKMLADAISYCKPDVNMLAVAVTCVMPFAFSSFSAHTARKHNLMFLLMAAVTAFVSDSFLFYAMLAISLFVYIGIAYKAPFGAIVSGAIVLPVSLIFVSDFTYSTAVTAFNSLPADGVFNLKDMLFASSWTALAEVCGAFTAVMLIAALVFILQRVLAGVVVLRSVKANIACGAIAAAAILLLAETFMFNIFADVRMILILWFILGMCGSAYKTYYNSQYAGEEE